MTSLELALIGNGTVAALVDERGTIVWGCVPRVDGDPVFCSLLRAPAASTDFGYFAIDLLDVTRAEQAYEANTPIVRTTLTDTHGAQVEIVDFAPRFAHYGRMFCPMMFVRQVRRVAGVPRIRVRLRPAAELGAVRRGTTTGSHHIRYVDGSPVLRLTTDASIAAVLEERAFVLEDAVTFLLGPDETVQGAAPDVWDSFYRETAAHWRGWVRSLAIPFEWQDDVIRAAITLQLNAVEDTGTSVAVITTSIPESVDGGRTWDYRYCWLRDAYMVVNALNRLGATRTMERYLHYIVILIAASPDDALQPVYGVSGEESHDLKERIESRKGLRQLTYGKELGLGNDKYELVDLDKQ